MVTAGKVTPVSSPIYLVACDPHRGDVEVFSGSTYHLALEGARHGLITGMLNLRPRGITHWRIYVQAALWKLAGGPRGRPGFKFTDEYQNWAWQRALPALRGSSVINNFQLFGTHFLSHHQDFAITPYSYIDGTLEEYFGTYKAFDTADIQQSTLAQALSAERESYAACRKIVTMSKRSAANLVCHYGVPGDKIRIIPPGANIPEELLEEFERGRSGRNERTDKSLVIGFVGLYPQRKGLPTIADAVRLARRGGYDVRLHVVGNCPAEIARQEGVTYFGQIDKGADSRRFIEILDNIDIGCLLPRAELAGIAYMEFLRLGVPIIAADVGGAPDIIELGAGILVSPEIRAKELAEQLASALDEPDRLTELREMAWRRRHNASWRRVIGELREVLD
jgi:glycosyltransferase involved in cell wall biosynthesis